MVRLAFYSILVVFFSLFAHVNVAAQSPGQMQLDVLARDHYTRAALDSVALAIYFDGMLLDSTVTGPDGRALMNFAVSLLDTPGEMPSGFTLSSNYPNPFHNETRVDMGVPESQPVRIEIFNILGQRVASQSLQLDAGRYALNLTMGHLPVGVYFLRVAGRDAKVEKMVKMGRSFSSPGPVFRMEPIGAGSHGRPVIDRKAGSDYMLSSEEGYLLRAWRDRYQNFETSPEIEGNPAELLVEMRRNNIVTIATVDPGEEPVSRQVRISGEQFTRTIATPDTLILASGIYTVVSTTDSLFAVNDVFEIVSRDSAYVIRPFIPEEAEISGRVASDQQLFVAGAQVKVFRDGSEYASTTTGADGRFSATLLADGGLYSLVIYPPAGNRVFDPETHSGFSPDARVITPHPGGSYELSFLLYTEPALALPGGGTDLPPGNYTLATDGGTVMVSNIPPDLGIVGGTARAYSPTITPDAFPGEFATRQNGLESGLISGGFASVNLLRSDGAGGVEPISELRDSTGTPVRVELRFRMDPLDYNVLRDPETLSHLPGYVNRPDSIDVPLYFYDEQLGDWILSPEFGWLESDNGAIPFDQFDAIREGTYEGTVYVTGIVDHFTFYNFDYPESRACVTGRILDQNFQPVPGAELVIRSMPEAQFVSYFSNVIRSFSNQTGYFQARVPRTETGPSDDWNWNNKVDFFRFNATVEDPIACTISYFDDGGSGYLTPFYTEDNGCKNIGSLRVSLREAKEKDFKITFLDIEREGQPDYPLFTTPAATSGFNYATATLKDNRISLMGPVWNCICDDGSAFQICNYQSTTDQAGRAEFTLPVLDSDPNLPLSITESLTGTFSYRKDRPDLGFGAYEFASCNYLVPENQGSRTVRCEVERRGPPDVDIVRIATADGFDEENPIQLSYLFDDLVVIEAEGEDLNGNPVESFYWSNPLETRLVANGQTASSLAWQLFGTGTDLGIMAHGFDFYGWRGTDIVGGIEVEEVEIEIVPNRLFIVPGDTTLVLAYVTGANNTNVNWSVNAPGIATINSSGILTALTPGEVIVTGRSAADPFKTDQVTIEVANLMAIFTVSPPAGDSTTVFTFDGSPSLGDIILYEWNFGDGATAQGEIVQHSYVSSSAFNASLTVTGTGGLKASSTSRVSTTGEPVAVISANPQGGSPPLTVQFDGSESFSISGAIIDWAWDFGDGNQGEGQLIEHTFTVAGEYYTSLTIEDESGRTGADSLKIVVSDGPIASFTVTPETGSAPLDVVVDATSSEGEIIRYSWDFGDGTVLNSGSAVETHTYISDGSYTIQLEVEDNFGATDQVMQIVNLEECELYQGNITIRQISDFQQLEGSCGVDGNLTLIGGGEQNVSDFSNLLNSTELSSLLPLSNLTTVKGKLSIQFFQNLTSIAGLNNIRQIGSLKIRNNDALESIAPLNNISGAVQDIEIASNAALSDFGMFDGITVIENDLRIFVNPSLETFTSFKNLERVERNFTVSETNISHCEMSDFVRELEGKGGVGGSIHIIRNANELQVLGSQIIENDDQVSALEGICAIRGGLTIRSDVQNLTGLDSLRTVTGDLSIQNAGSLQSLQGLNNLSRVENLLIRSNSQLTDISALGQLKSVNNILSLWDLPAIQNLNGLQNITELNNLVLRGLPSFTSLEGIQNLQSTVYLTLRDLPVLSTESGFDSLRRVSRVWLINLEVLQDLSMFSQVERFSWSVLEATPILEIRNLPALESLIHLQNLQDSDAIALRIENTPLLSSLNGLDNLTEFTSVLIQFADNLQSLEGLHGATSIGTLNLRDLQSLSDLNGLSGLQSLTFLTVWNNPSFSDFTGLSSSIETNIVFNVRNNPSLLNMAGLEWLESAGRIEVNNNSNMQNMNGLDNLSYLENALRIQNNQNLTSLSGLDRLEFAGEIEVSSNDNLVSLNGLEKLAHLNGPLNIQNNQNLTSIEALSSLVTLAPPGATKSFNITQNGRLMSLKGLGNIQIEPDAISPLIIFLSENHSLKNMEGLEFADFIGNLIISNNDSLLTLEGLENLKEANTLRISENSRLQNTNDVNSVTKLHTLVIRDNPLLDTISGMSALSRVNNAFSIVSNSSLATCDAELLRDQVLARDGIGGFVSISNNNNSGTCPP